MFNRTFFGKPSAFLGDPVNRALFFLNMFFLQFLGFVAFCGIMPNLHDLYMNCDYTWSYAASLQLCLCCSNTWHFCSTQWVRKARNHVHGSFIPWLKLCHASHVRSAMDSWDHTQCLCLRFWQGSQHTCIVHACACMHALICCFCVQVLWRLVPLMHGASIVTACFCACVCVSVHASNATNLIAAFGWKSFIRSI